MEVENKFGKIKTVEEAMERITDGCTIMIAGFGGIGSSYRLVNEIIKKNVKNLTLISIDAGDPEVGPDYIVRGEQVKLSGFGNFDLREKKERPGRNPKTGEEIPITARRVVTFRPGQKLKSRVESYVGHDR